MDRGDDPTGMNVAVLNLAAVVFVALSAALANGLRAFVFPRLSHTLVWVIALGACVLADLLWRWRFGKNGRWIAPSQGGSFLLVPVWAIAMLWMAKIGYETLVGPLPHVSVAAIMR